MGRCVNREFPSSAAIFQKFEVTASKVFVIVIVNNNFTNDKITALTSATTITSLM